MLSATWDKGSCVPRHNILVMGPLKASIEGIEVEIACWSKFPENINTVCVADKIQRSAALSKVVHEASPNLWARNLLIEGEKEGRRSQSDNQLLFVGNFYFMAMCEAQGTHARLAYLPIVCTR